MKEQPELTIYEVPTSELIPYANNAKEHDREQVETIVNSIEDYGFNDPIAVWHNAEGQMEIVEGHGRVLAAKRMGLEVVPVIYLDHLSDQQRREYVHVHNQTTLNSVMDFEILQSEFEDFTGFDPERFGFDEIIEEVAEAIADEPEPEVPFTEVLGEENNYIVLKFENEIDWLNAQSLFGIEPRAALSTRKDGYTSDGMKKRVGVGRVIKGAEAINRILGGVL